MAGSVVEQLKLVDPLTNPTAHGGSASDAFHVVIPSMAGYGFSGKPTIPGWDTTRMARAWTVLMKRLGYTRYVAQGGDWGAFITEQMGVLAPPELLGIHIHLPSAVPAEIFKALQSGSPPPGLAADESKAFERLAFLFAQGLPIFNMMAPHPQALYAIADSPRWARRLGVRDGTARAFPRAVFQINHPARFVCLIKAAGNSSRIEGYTTVATIAAIGPLPKISNARGASAVGGIAAVSWRHGSADGRFAGDQAMSGITPSEKVRPHLLTTASTPAGLSRWMWVGPLIPQLPTDLRRYGNGGIGPGADSFKDHRTPSAIWRESRQADARRPPPQALDRRSICKFESKKRVV
jgi:hypothetical protein